MSRGLLVPPAAAASGRSCGSKVLDSSGLAFARRSTLIAPMCPFPAAVYSGVVPLGRRVSGFAPPSISADMISQCPLSAAMCSAVKPLAALVSRPAPASASIFVTSRCPC